MRAGLMLGLVGLALVAAPGDAEARGRRGGGVFFIAQSHAAPADAQATRRPEPPRVRTAAAGGPEPMTTGTTAPAPAVPVARSAAAPAPAPAPARPWCAGRVFGSGAGFCAIN